MKTLELLAILAGSILAGAAAWLAMPLALLALSVLFALARRKPKPIDGRFRPPNWFFALASLLSLLSLDALSQPATIPSAYLKTRFNTFTNAIATNIGGTYVGWTGATNDGVPIAGNSALYFSNVNSNGLPQTNFNMIPLNRGRGLAFNISFHGTNVAGAGTNLLTALFTVSHDGTNWVQPGIGGLTPFMLTCVAAQSNLVWTAGEFGFDQFPVQGPFTNGVLAGVPGAFGIVQGTTFTNVWGPVSPLTQVYPLDNFQYIMLLGFTNIGAQPVWLSTNGCWWSAFP